MVEVRRAVSRFSRAGSVGVRFSEGSEQAGKVRKYFHLDLLKGARFEVVVFALAGPTCLGRLFACYAVQTKCGGRVSQWLRDDPNFLGMNMAEMRGIERPHSETRLNAVEMSGLRPKMDFCFERPV